MITKIEKLKNIGNFEDYRARGDVTLKKLSIVYANNGAGKTTLARVLHSLSTNDPGVVLRLKRINGTGNPEITIKNETPSPFVFSGTHWNRPCPDIEVFDSHFVANNVYSGFEINSEHHKSLYQFVVGASGVAVERDRAGFAFADSSASPFVGDGGVFARAAGGGVFFCGWGLHGGCGVGARRTGCGVEHSRGAVAYRAGAGIGDGDPGVQGWGV